MVLLHVIEVIAGVSMVEEKEFYARLEKAALKHLKRLGSRLNAQKVPWRAEILYGSRGPEIVRYADKARADLIVLTAPRLDPRKPGSSWGSLSYKVGFLSPCPVLLVK